MSRNDLNNNIGFTDNQGNQDDFPQAKRELPTRRGQQGLENDDYNQINNGYDNQNTGDYNSQNTNDNGAGRQQLSRHDLNNDEKQDNVVIAWVKEKKMWLMSALCLVLGVVAIGGWFSSAMAKSNAERAANVARAGKLDDQHIPRKVKELFDSSQNIKDSVTLEDINALDDLQDTNIPKVRLLDKARRQIIIREYVNTLKNQADIEKTDLPHLNSVMTELKAQDSNYYRHLQKTVNTIKSRANSNSSYVTQVNNLSNGLTNGNTTGAQILQLSNTINRNMKQSTLKARLMNTLASMSSVIASKQAIDKAKKQAEEDAKRKQEEESRVTVTQGDDSNDTVNEPVDDPSDTSSYSDSGSSDTDY